MLLNSNANSIIGANFALVPHVHPHANGIVSGLVGASGNFGGVIFAIIFRFVLSWGCFAFGVVKILTVSLDTTE
jgi:NNP family nitrate/nitrite transporter-like MFS transporter